LPRSNAYALPQDVVGTNKHSGIVLAPVRQVPYAAEHVLTGYTGLRRVEDNRVTIRDAAILLGISEGAVRKRVDRGSIEHVRGDDGKGVRLPTPPG
jgi:hypothetical protein